jgi:sucrose phosphorylase
MLLLTSQCFIVLRVAPGCEKHILTVTNVTNQICHLEIPLAKLQLDNSDSLVCATPEDNYWYDLVGKRGWRVQQQKISLILQPYDVVWLIPFVELERSLEDRDFHEQ